jgi:basic membrane protein A
VAAQFPKSKFAITDYCAKGATAHCITGSVLTKNHKNVMGLDYAANQSGCLVGYLAAEMAKKHGGKQIIGAVGGLHIPPVDIWIAGYKFCAKLYNKNVQVLVQYSGEFVKQDPCKAISENMLAQGAQVLFQVAGGCGLGTLKAAAEHHIWGIGVDKDQYKDAARVLTSGVKRVDLGVFNVIKATKAGKFNGNHDLQFTLKNGGMGVGKINPAVPKKFITAMNAIKTRIIKGKLHVPIKLK